MSAEPPLVEEHARRLLNALTGAVVRALRRQDSLALAASGGLDSSVLAVLLKQYADVSLQLVTVSVPGAVDADRARRLARHLSLPLVEVVATRARVESALADLVPLVAKGTGILNPDRLGSALTSFLAAKEARRFSTVLVVPQGADQSLAAPLEQDPASLEKEVLPIESRIANHWGIRFAYPFLDAGVRAVGRGIPAEALDGGGDRKAVLRSVARGLGLPEDLVSVPGTAAPDGSGVGAVIKELAEATGRPLDGYLAGFLRRRA